MRIKLTLGSGPASRDLMVTADATATIGDLAQTLARTTGQPASHPLTIRLHDLPTAPSPQAPIVLDPELPVGESPLRSGITVTLAEASAHFVQGGDRGQAAAVLRIVEGPDVGREYPLPFGSSYVGRSADCDVVLRDGFVSKRHLRISVTDSVEVVDLGSANGIHLDGEQVQRAVVRPDDQVAVGDSVFTVSPLTRLVGDGGGGIGFNRRPVVVPVYEGDKVALPEPPQPPRPMQFPVVALLAPLMLGGVMFALFPNNKTSLVFIALSPLLMLGSFADQWRQGRREGKRQRADFEESLRVMREELRDEQAVEVQARLREHPSTAEATVAIEERNGLLWSRRPDRPGFLELRLGLGAVKTRTTIEVPDRRRANAADWSTLKAFESEFSHVSGAPIVAPLSEAGGIGVAGPESVMVGVARSLVVQLTALHSPSELALVALGSTASVGAWSWLKWLPHVGSGHSPLKDAPLSGNAVSALRLVAEIEELIAARSADTTPGSGEAAPMVPALVALVLDDAPVERSRLVQIAETGPAVGVHVIWCAASIAQIPAACRSFVELPLEGPGAVGMVHLGEEIHPVTCEFVDDPVAIHVARRMSPIVDAGARVRDDSDLPRAVSFLGSLGTDLGQSPEAVLERWRASDPTLVPGGKPRKEPLALRAVVGHGAADVFPLDLRVHGPHALVGGTTGAGKSEFLQTWVLGMATSQSPKRVTFLFVDYKGGSAFASCIDLPHTVGLVTDLSPHLVRRALTSLRAELTYRETVLHQYGAKDLIELERNVDAPQMPSLVIIVDEFAALVQEVPEFVDGVIDVAQRGRSLGLHLILATQRPSGVIKGNLRANTNLRVALRMADSDDSTDVVGDAIAAGFDPSVPGRAAAKTGPGRLSVFQSLYVGGATPEVAPRPEISVETLVFGSSERLVAVEDPGASPAVSEDETTDIDKVVEQVRQANRALGLEPPRRPWLDVLAPIYDWTLLGQRSDAELVLGVQDQPQKQSNRNVHFRPDIDGNMAIFGTGGSGKSTLLRTIAVSAAVTPRGGPCDVYALDFGSRGLAMLDGLPNVGAVINGTDHERVARLMRMLRTEIDDRARRYAAAGASNITEYRTNTGHSDERRLLVLVDGFGAFKQEYEIGGKSALFTQFGQLAADGRGVGIHFVLTADRPGSIPPSLAATIQRRLILRLSDSNDYGLVGAPSDVLSEESPPGRGILDGYEVQIAVLGASASLPKQVEGIARLNESMTRQGRLPAVPIERLQERIPLETLPRVGDGRLAIGISDEDLRPYSIEASGTFLVIGPPASGRTTTLAMLTNSVLRERPDAQVFLFARPRSVLLGLTRWTGEAVNDTDATELAERLTDEIRSGRVGGRQPAMIVFEGLADLGSASDAMETLAKVAADHGVLVVGEEETSAISQAWGPAQYFKSARRGVALQPDEMDGLSGFKTNFPRMSRSEFPQGRGIVVDSGATHRVQICLPE